MNVSNWINTIILILLHRIFRVRVNLQYLMYYNSQNQIIGCYKIAIAMSIMLFGGVLHSKITSVCNACIYCNQLQLPLSLYDV